MEAISYNIVKTHIIDEKRYIDVCVLNGVVKTQLYEKIEEPNIFSMKKEIDGDDINKLLGEIDG